MLNRLRRSWLDIALVIILLVAAAIAFSVSQAKPNAEREMTRLEGRISAAELNLNKIEKETNLESLRQSLEQAQSALAQNPFPSQAEAEAVTDHIMQYAQKNNITIVAWSSSPTSISLKAKKYPAIRHSLVAEGEAYALKSFIKALTHGSVLPVIQSMDITQVRDKKGIWQMKLEILVYYSES